MDQRTRMNVYGSTERIGALRDRYVEARVSVCLDRAVTYTELYRETEAEPMVIRRARAFKRYCETKPIRIEDGELIVASQGERPRVAVICPEIHACWLDAEIETVSDRAQDPYHMSAEQRALWRERISPYWKHKTVFEHWAAQVPERTREISYDTGVIDCLLRSENGPGYQTPGFAEVIFPKGFDGVRDDARAKLESLDPTEPGSCDQIDFLNSVIIVCEAMTCLGERHARLAREMAAAEADALRRAELETIAAVCDRIPARPPATFHEAVQMVWFVMMAIQIEATADSVAVGRFDQFMYPYYERDVAENRLSREGALELIENLWIKFYGNIWPQSEPGAMYFSGYHPFTALTIGGVTPDGRDATNELSYLCIEAPKNLHITQPSLGTRIHQQTPHRFLVKNCELIREGLGFPAIHNDEPGIKMLLKKGVTMAEARNWNTLGCVEPSLAGKLHQWTAAGNYNLGSAIELALFDGVHEFSGKRLGVPTGDPRSFATYEDFEAAVRTQIEFMLRQHAIATGYIERIHRDVLPCPLLSCLTLDCVENARELMQGGARYNVGPGNLGIGLADCANSLSAVKHLVYERKSVSWDRLLDALRTDFEHDEELRNLLREAPKWGNDDDRVDDLGRGIADFTIGEHHRYRTLHGRYLMPALLPVSSNVPMGKAVWALPSGRRAGEPLADGISPNHDTDLNGPTAVLKSVSKLNHEDVDGGTLLNMKFDPCMLADEARIDRFASFLRTFVDLGVYHVQFNVVDAETLRAAMEHPDDYRSLMVRVAGYSAFFTELCPEIQEDIIARSEYGSY